MVKLTGRDLEDAKRLLSLLTLAGGGGRLLIEPAEAEAREGRESRLAMIGTAHQMLANRQRRHKHFGKAIGEPAWDMLLLLFVLEEGPRQSVTSLAQLSGHSRSTAWRWMEYLEKKQLLVRENHPTDKRSAFVRLSETGRAKIELYLAETVAAQD